MTSFRSSSYRHRRLRTRPPSTVECRLSLVRQTLIEPCEQALSQTSSPKICRRCNERLPSAWPHQSPSFGYLGPAFTHLRRTADALTGGCQLAGSRANYAFCVVMGAVISTINIALARNRSGVQRLAGASRPQSPAERRTNAPNARGRSACPTGRRCTRTWPRKATAVESVWTPRIIPHSSVMCFHLRCTTRPFEMVAYLR